MNRTYLFFIFFFSTASCIVPQTYKDDTTAVRALLDLNNLKSISAQTVTDTNNGRVVFLSFYKLGISILNDQIGKLTALEHLCLYGNSLSSIPSCIGDITTLTVLDAQKNTIAKIPAEIGNCTRLKEILLAKNSISEIPASIGSLKSLELLELDENNITRIPSELCGLSSLKSFYLYKNKVQNLPPDIGTLKSLEKLSVCSNAIADLPVSIVQIQPRYLDIGYNKISVKNVPKEIVDWANQRDPDWKETQKP